MLLLALAACGGTTSVTGSADSGERTPRPKTIHPRSTAETIALTQRFANVPPPQAYALLGGLSKPASHPAAASHGTSVILPQAIAPGAQYDAASEAGWMAKSGNVTTSEAGATLTPSKGGFPDNFAYIIYRFDSVGLWDAQEPLSIKLELGSFSGNFGVAAYDWGAGSLGQWKPLYYGATSAQQAISLKVAGADFTNADDNLAFVVFCMDPASLSLTSVALSNYETNIAPWSSLVVDGSVKVSQSATLDASASGDTDGTISSYEFDAEGDGTWVANGNNATYDYTYTTVGIHQPLVRVTDSEGKSSTSQASVLVMPATYDEVENNDDFAAANVLPAIPFENFSANCGDTGGNDGDTIDIFTFDAQSGDEVSFEMTTGSVSCSMQMTLLDSQGAQLATGFAFSPLHYEFTGGETGPFYLQVDTFSGSSDYMLSAYDDLRYDEFEDNDNAISANALWQLSQYHQLAQFDGSLGSSGSYPGNDGDSSDWFSIDSGVIGSTVNLELGYDGGTGNLGFTLFDGEGDVLANSATGSGHESASYTLVAGDVAPLYLYIAAASGYSDYEMSGGIAFDGSNYDESEPNDDSSEVTAMPALPFSGFAGNVGYGGNYADDGQDYYTFNANPGDTVKLTVNLDNPSSQARVDVWDQVLFQSLGVPERNGNTITYTAPVPQDASGTIIMVIWDYQGASSDYTVDAEIMP
jgi:hypothetical protein